MVYWISRESCAEKSDGTVPEDEYMQSLEFTTEELDVLRELLRAKIDEIDVETFRTDTHDFKQMLKHRRDVLEHMMIKLTNLPVAV
ncbi:MAG TPA: hypothetical protein VL793_01530 [Patescibacteria group bacterium]|nr:hypothetical protein [Patescibacteria group bacterium]